MAHPTRRREAATFRPPAVWQPFRLRDELQRRTAELMQSVRSRVRAGDGPRCVLAVDLEETDEAWIGEAELPGVRRGDVTVELAELAVRAVRVPRPGQPRPRRVVVQVRAA